MRLEIISPRSERAKLSPSHVLLTWRLTNDRGVAVQADQFVITIRSVKKSDRLPKDIASWNADKLLQWMSATQPPTAHVESRKEITKNTSLLVSLAPESIYHFEVVAKVGANISYASKVVLTKPTRNYLRERVERQAAAPRGKRSTLFPLIMFQLDRYINTPDDQYDAFDRAFNDVLKLRQAHLGGVSVYKRILKNWAEVPIETRVKVYGPAPQNAADINWRKKAIHSLFDGSPLVDILAKYAEVPRTYGLSFKNPRIEASQLSTGKQFNASSEYMIQGALWLCIKAGQTSRWLKIRKNIEAQSLAIDDESLMNLDASTYFGQIWNLPEGAVPDPSVSVGTKLSEGRVTIQAGAPLILSISPSSIQLDAGKMYESFRITVRDGATPGTVMLVMPDASLESAKLTLVEKTFEHQTFEVSYGDTMLSSGTHALWYTSGQSAGGKRSLNSQPLTLTDTLYDAYLDVLQCHDESNPERFGDDTIQVAMNWGTDTRFESKPVMAYPNMGFSDGAVRTFDPPIRIYGPRAIEGSLGFSVAIIEIDDLGWIAESVEIFCWAVVLGLTALAGIFTIGIGSIFVFAVGTFLFQQGLFAELGELIADGFSGFGKEVLHRGAIIFGEFGSSAAEKTLNMTTSESQYSVKLRVKRSALGSHSVG